MREKSSIKPWSEELFDEILTDMVQIIAREMKEGRTIDEINEALDEVNRAFKVNKPKEEPLAVRNAREAKRIKEMKLKKKNTKMNNLVVIKAPEKLTNGGTTVFLAGSIEMGKATDWQTKIENELRDRLDGDQMVTLYNPRRDDWDSSWEQTIENDNFREQVEWELNALEKADKIVVYIDPETKSPITLLEIGLHAHSGNMCVCCPDGFYRKGNIDIVCNKHDIPMVDDVEGLIDFILK
jgi:DNA-binding transcriptional MerR regulator